MPKRKPAPPVTLKEFLEETGTYYRAFAEEGGFSIFAVRKWLSGERVPRDRNKVKIAKMTKGRVPVEIWIKG
jgi:hypothetical protein